jgi:hypothetical protein
LLLEDVGERIGNDPDEDEQGGKHEGWGAIGSGVRTGHWGVMGNPGRSDGKVALRVVMRT